MSFTKFKSLLICSRFALRADGTSALPAKSRTLQTNGSRLRRFADWSKRSSIPTRTFPHTAALQSTNQIDRVDVRPWRRPLRVHHESRTHVAPLTPCLPPNARLLSSPPALTTPRSFPSSSSPH